MKTGHDPTRQIGYLQQCLGSDKKPLGLFLGAGCPLAIVSNDNGKSPLIPDIEGITKIVREKLAACNVCGPHLGIIEGHFKTDGHDGTNVEHMLSHIRALRAVAGKAKARELDAASLDVLDEKICNLIHELANKSLPDLQTPYHRIAAWVDEAGREMPVEIFTTNYDLLAEQALEDCHVPYFDGFAGTRRPFFDIRAMEEDMLPPRWARLWKLHGSINWYQVEEKGVFRGSVNEESGPKRVIHPSHLKYDETRRMPYLAMIDKLRAFFRQPTSALVVCGYSFRDKHLNEIILQGLQGAQTSIVFAFLYGDLKNYPQAVKLATGRKNLSLLARDAAVIGGSEARWIEVEADSASTDAGGWVKWLPADPAKPDGKRKAEFCLGDFGLFGDFLKELTGSGRAASKVSNDK